MAGQTLTSGLVLAGGESRRFGANKLLADFNGTTMVEHVVGVISPVVDEAHLSVADDSVLPPGLRDRAIVDVVGGIGPLGGIYSGLMLLNADWLLVLAADLPFLTEGSVGRLAAGRSSDSEAILACDSNNRVQPLAACYHSSTRPAAEACIAEGQYAMMHFITRLGKVEHVTLPDHELTNVNRPEDLDSGTPRIRSGQASHSEPRTSPSEPRTSPFAPRTS